MQRILLCHNVVMAKENILYSNLDSKSFHNLSELKQTWPPDTNFITLQNEVNFQTFFVAFKDKETTKFSRCNFWRKTSIKLFPFNFLNRWQVFLQNNNQKYAKNNMVNHLYEILNTYDDHYEQTYGNLKSTFCNFANDYLSKIQTTRSLISDEKAEYDSKQTCNTRSSDNVTSLIKTYLSEDFYDISDDRSGDNSSSNESDENSFDDEYDVLDDDLIDFDDDTLFLCLSKRNQKNIKYYIKKNKNMYQMEWLNSPSLDTYRGKIDWADKLYRMWCEKNEITEIYPLSENIAKFIITLNSGTNPYALNTIRTIINHLKYASLKISAKKIDVTTQNEIRNTFSRLENNNKKIENKTKGANPVCYEDLELMFGIVEDSAYFYTKKLFCFSLYLFAFYTGSRSITCTNIQLKDISVIFQEGNCIVISIEQNRTKGSSNWQHPVAFEGNIEHKDLMCFVYWLNAHLKKQFGLQLSSWKLDEDQKDFYLWGDKKNQRLTTNAISKLFVNFADRSGFINVSKISFHSFRSGFLLSAIYNNNLKSKNLETMLGNIAIIGGWNLGGEFLKTYVKIQTRKTIIANNVVNFLELEPNTSKNLMKPNVKHNNILQNSLWKAHNFDINLRSFSNEVNKITNFHTEKQKISFWSTWAYSFYVSESSELKKRAKEQYLVRLNENNFRERTVDIEIGKQEVLNIIGKKNELDFQNLVNKFAGYKQRFLKKYKPSKIDLLDKNNHKDSYESLRVAVLRKINLSSNRERQTFWKYSCYYYAEECKIEVNYEIGKKNSKEQQHRKAVKEHVLSLLNESLNNGNYEETLSNLTEIFSSYQARFCRDQNKK